MPYGLGQVCSAVARIGSFNPSYGLHALRAFHMGIIPYGDLVSIPHMGCMPYGHYRRIWPVLDGLVSIPHMGCMPYGHNQFHPCHTQHTCFNPSYGLHALRARSMELLLLRSTVSIPHMGCMPYGHSGGNPKLAQRDVSIPHMGCMPYGLWRQERQHHDDAGFNPSYGLHALRALTIIL